MELLQMLFALSVHTLTDVGCVSSVSVLIVSRYCMSGGCHVLATHTTCEIGDTILAFVGNSRFGDRLLVCGALNMTHCDLSQFHPESVRMRLVREDSP